MINKNNYGLSQYDIAKTYSKIEKQTAFLKSHYIQMQGQKIPLHNFFKNTFVNPDRYIAELQHRVWSLVEYAQGRDLVNVFLTLTLPSEYHRKKKIGKNKVINNPKFANSHLELYDIFTKRRADSYNKAIFKYYKTKKKRLHTGNYTTVSLLEEDYTPLKGSHLLTKMFERIRKDRAFQEIDKDDRVYFRVTEPHHDGTPHLHISLFMPKDKVSRFLQMVHRLYPAPQADIMSTYIPAEYQEVEKVWFSSKHKKWQSAYKINKEDKHYIKLQIEDSVGYLMKYIYKTLDDMRDGKNFTEITLWYIHHGICRFYTSRTLISLDVYRPLGGQLTLLELTRQYRDNEITVYLDSETRAPQMIVTDQHIIFKKRNFKLEQFTKEEKKEQNLYVEEPKDTLGYIQKIDIDIDGEDYIIYRNDPIQSLHRVKKDHELRYQEIADHFNYIMPPPQKMDNAQLWRYYESINPVPQNVEIYKEAREELISRHLLKEESMGNLEYYQAMEVF
ncbi:MAG: replication endonuclease [Campylobacterota bacterium]|nr:replication endonuclease [Campylobacterota bacterium]